jgi:NAD(P)-dependent dehydrogenase (short-subunit alcohol dehydrogenase family)
MWSAAQHRGAPAAARYAVLVPSAVVIGASVGIGAAIVRRLVADGWTVIGLARRDAQFAHERYRHVIADVRTPALRETLAAIESIDVCIYAAGIGELLAWDDFTHEADVFTTNLVGVATTAESVLPRMVAARHGHFIGLSSQADRWIDDHAPSYAASKAGMSSYLEGLALACKRHGVCVTNVRLGFVDTAMAKSDVKPFMITADRAAELVVKCIAKRPIRYTYPWRMSALLWLGGIPRRLRIWLS